MSYGWTGTSLEIDLSRGKIEKKQSDPQLYRTFLGGKGVNIKLFWDRVPPEVDAFSPENLLIFSVGPLVGTSAPTASRLCVTCKSPLTKLFSTSAVGGYWAAELKHAGYDAVVISGKASSPVYLWINNGDVEIRDAGQLWGKDTVETHRLIREELKNEKAQIACIGLAGENRNYAAAIMHDTKYAAGRAASGAVMGDKNLKAVAVHGTRDVAVARPSELMELNDWILKRSEPLRDYYKNFVHYDGVWVQDVAKWAIYGNVDQMPEGMGFEKAGELYAEFAGKYLSRETSCYNCPYKCMGTFSLPGMMPVTVKCDGWSIFMHACKILDFAFNMKCVDLCARHGLDHRSTANQIAFAIDLYQKGLLSREDTDGLHLEYGNPELVFTMIDKLARREGIGNVLADGVYAAAKAIGGGAGKYAHHVKGLETKFHTYYEPYYAFCTAIGDRQDTPNAATGALTPQAMTWGMDPHKYVEEGWFTFPDEWEKYMYVDYSVDYEGIAEAAYYGENVKTLTDLTGLCWIACGFWCFPAIKLNTIAKLISYATGMDVDEAEAVKMASRTRALIQAYNVRLGVRRKDDTVPETFFEKPVTGFQKKIGLMQLDHDKWDKQLDRYYGFRGWNSDGVPTGETLDKLGLSYVRRDLEKRKIL